MFILLFSRPLTVSPASKEAICSNYTETKRNKSVSKTESDSPRSNLWNIVSVKYTCRPTRSNIQCLSVKYTCRPTWGNSVCQSSTRV